LIIVDDQMRHAQIGDALRHRLSGRQRARIEKGLFDRKAANEIAL